MKTVNIKGKDYVEVKERVKKFWKDFPAGSIQTEIVKLEEKTCVIKATIRINEKIVSTGYAYEKEGNGFINKDSYIENCETSAVGRALGLFGIGIDASIASAEEVEPNTTLDASDYSKIESAKTLSELIKVYKEYKGNNKKAFEKACAERKKELS